jgi:DNA-binding transcriptional MerR regulator
MPVRKEELPTDQELAWPNTPMQGYDEVVEPGGYSIGNLAKEYGITLRALRFYESKGLLAPRRDGSVRVYTDEDRNRLSLILQGKRLGFTLVEIRALLAAQADGEPGRAPLKLTRQQCIDQIRMLERQKRELEEAISELRRTYSSLYQGPALDLMSLS